MKAEQSGEIERKTIAERMREVTRLAIDANQARDKANLEYLQEDIDGAVRHHRRRINGEIELAAQSGDNNAHHAYNEAFNARSFNSEETEFLSSVIQLGYDTLIKSLYSDGFEVEEDNKRDPVHETVQGDRYYSYEFTTTW